MSRDLDLDFASLRTRLESRATRSIAGSPGGSRASVAAILRSGEAMPELLFIRRADRVGDPWSGHMAFPGGRAEPSDADALATAIRETSEEIGLDLATAELLGRLDDIHAVSRARLVDLVITPFVFALKGQALLTPNDEIAETMWAPLGPLVMGETATTIDYVREGQTLTLPALRVGEHVVWGLTYQMLTLLFEVLRG